MHVLLYKLRTLLIFIIAAFFQAQAGADILIFSFDRPLQCYALLESLEKYVTGIENISVLYRVSSSEFDDAYKRCFERFRTFHINAVKQGDDPRRDFRLLTITLLAKFKGKYVLFAVDDLIVKDYVNLDACIHHLESLKAYGFYLRLGKHISRSYTADTASPLPHYTQHNEVMCWKLSDGSIEWRYLDSLDMTLYRRLPVLKTLAKIMFSSPNTLEAAWDRFSRQNGDLNNNALCYTDSKAMNIPLNLVQLDWQSAYNMKYDVHELLDLFNQGYRITIESYFKFNNTAPHVELIPRLIRRI